MDWFVPCDVDAAAYAQMKNLIGNGIVEFLCACSSTNEMASTTNGLILRQFYSIVGGGKEVIRRGDDY